MQPKRNRSGIGAIQELYPESPYIRSSDTPPAPTMPGLGPLEQAIGRNLENELYRRGYGPERFGGLNENSNNWLWVMLAAVGLWLWTT